MYRGDGGRPQYGVDARVDRLMLARALSFLPDADRRFAGTGTLMVRRAARRDARGDRRVPRRSGIRQRPGADRPARAGRMDVLARWAASRGAAICAGQTGRLAGGRVGGEAHFALGDRRDFRARTLRQRRRPPRHQPRASWAAGRSRAGSRGMSTSTAPTRRSRSPIAATWISTWIRPRWSTSRCSTSSTARSARPSGGVFDDGDLHGTISERKVHIDNLTLVGPLAQVHASGTLDFDGRLNLEVVVNNNKGIPESGQVMMARVAQRRRRGGHARRADRPGPRLRLERG